jgi:hypothetical protein
MIEPPLYYETAARLSIRISQRSPETRSWTLCALPNNGANLTLNDAHTGGKPVQKDPDTIGKWAIAMKN